uniref:GP3 glycoprotein n=1 Tax=Equine arteritis virus TaxID=11047 RepID=V9IT13_EAV|nr:GP3 glycoprotein [Equine arteritis virus]AFM56303.1 GP3 glycoprotein [Equine arteritis virus]
MGGAYGGPAALLCLFFHFFFVSRSVGSNNTTICMHTTSDTGVHLFYAANVTFPSHFQRHFAAAQDFVVHTGYEYAGVTMLVHLFANLVLSFPSLVNCSRPVQVFANASCVQVVCNITNSTPGLGQLSFSFVDEDLRLHIRPTLICWFALLLVHFLPMPRCRGT